MTTTEIRKTVWRFLYIAFGFIFMIAGVVGRTPWMPNVPRFNRVGAIAGGGFVAYVGLMYYFPKNRKKRRELDALIAEAEREQSNL